MVFLDAGAVVRAGGEQVADDDIVLVFRDGVAIVFAAPKSNRVGACASIDRVEFAPATEGVIAIAAQKRGVFAGGDVVVAAAAEDVVCAVAAVQSVSTISAI